MGSVTNTYTRNRCPTVWTRGLHSRRSTKLIRSFILNNDLLVPLNPVKHPSPHPRRLLLFSTSLLAPHRAQKACCKRKWYKDSKGAEDAVGRES